MLTPRLERIIKRVNSKTAADIGCDHAYIPISLILENRAERVIASDIKKGPLSIAEKNIEKYGFSDKIETRLGYGLDVISPKEVDTVIIAGMGGEIIEEILRNGRNVTEDLKLILQPMNSQYELRKYLILNGYKITGEDIAKEGFKAYNIIEAERGFSEPFENEFYYQIPPYLYGHENFRVLYEKKKREFERIVYGLKNAANFDKEKYDLYKYFLKELKNI